MRNFKNKNDWRWAPAVGRLYENGARSLAHMLRKDLGVSLRVRQEPDGWAVCYKFSVRRWELLRPRIIDAAKVLGREN